MVTRVLTPFSVPAVVAGVLLVAAACEDPGSLAPDAPVPWEVPGPQMSAAIDDVITGRKFKFEIDGKSLPVTSTEPGAFRAELKEATMGNRKGNFKTFTVTKPNFDTWRVEKYFDNGELTLKNLFEAFATGARKTNPSDAGSLVYLDRNDEEARRIDFFGYHPVSYDIGDPDEEGRRIESLEFSVEGMRFSSSGGGGAGRVALGEIVCREDLKKDDGPVVTKSHRRSAPVPGSRPDAWGQPGDEGAAPSALGGDVQINNISMFRLDLMAGSGAGPSANWYSVRGGSQILHASDKARRDEGKDSRGFTCHVEGRPRDATELEPGELRVVGPMVSGGSRAEMLELLNAWTAEGNRRRASSTLDLEDADGRTVARARYHGVIPVYYAPPSVRVDADEDPLAEAFTFAAVQITVHDARDEDDDEDGG